MVERVSVNLNGPLEYDSEGEERPASPAQDSETLYALIFNVSLGKYTIELLSAKNGNIKLHQDANLSVDKNTSNETFSRSFSVYSIEFVDKESSKDDKQ